VFNKFSYAGATEYFKSKHHQAILHFPLHLILREAELNNVTVTSKVNLLFQKLNFSYLNSWAETLGGW
jgi:hypothetical protein